MPGPTKSTLGISTGTGAQATGYNDENGNFTSGTAHHAYDVITNTGGWNAGTALNSDINSKCEGYGIGIITLVNSGSVSGGVVVFEVSDVTSGDRWFTIPAARVNSIYADFGSYALNQGNQAWKLDLAGWKRVRVRLSVAITGTSPSVSFNLVVEAGTAPQFQQATLTTGLKSDIDSITTVPRANTPYRIATNASIPATSIKAGPGILHGIAVGDPGTAWQADFYDNPTATGTPIFTLKPTKEGAIPMSSLGFVNGMSVLTSGTTPGNLTLMVS